MMENGRVGYGKVVHQIFETKFGLATKCGAERNNTGTRRRRSLINPTDEAVTCKRCLAQMAEQQSNEPAIADEAPAIGEVEMTGPVILIRRLC